MLSYISNQSTEMQLASKIKYGMPRIYLEWGPGPSSIVAYFASLANVTYSMCVEQTDNLGEEGQTRQTTSQAAGSSIFGQ